MEYQPIERETPTGKAAPNPKNSIKAENISTKKLAESIVERDLDIVKKEVNTIVKMIEKKERLDKAEKAMNKIQQQKLTSLLEDVFAKVNKINSQLTKGLEKIAETKNNSISDIAINLQNQGKLKVAIEME